jgi:hypothetical protein
MEGSGRRVENTEIGAMARSQKVRDWLKATLQPTLDILGTTSSAYVEVKSQLNDMARDLISFSTEAAGPRDERLRAFVSLIRPVTSPELRLQRVGRDGDGGYVMADMAKPAWAVSLGVGTDVSWDRAVSKMGGRVALFDPTVRRLPEPVPGGKFFRLGLGSGTDADYLPLADLMRLAAVPGPGVGWLKCDVEGAEWFSLTDQDADSLDSFDQMVFELHDLSGLAHPERAEKILATTRALMTNHLPIYVHANNFSRLARFDNDWFPDAIEISFVHKSRIKRPAPADSLAVSMDRACDPRVSDISLEGILSLPVGDRN